jgi:hypothetical protein
MKLWPFTHLFNGVHSVRLRAAKAVLLSLHLFPLLSAEQQAAVEKELEDWHSKHSEFSYSYILSRCTPTQLAALRAVAMARLKINTGIEALKWEDLLGWKWRLHPHMLNLSFREFDAATDEALEFLRAYGIKFADSEKLGKRWLNTMKAKYP